MSFKEIRDAFLAADSAAVADWERICGRCGEKGANLEERVECIEYRRCLLAGAVCAILTELVTREEQIKC